MIRLASLGWIRAAAVGSFQASSACKAPRPSLAARSSSRVRNSESAAGPSKSPSVIALMYRLVPPTASGIRPPERICSTARSAYSRNLATLKLSLGSTMSRQ